MDLRGFDPSGKPMPPAVAVRGFLDALGVDPAAIPVELDAQAALYRSLVADKRMLIVLDNARSTDPSRPAPARHLDLHGDRHQPRPAHRPGHRARRAPDGPGRAHRDRGPRAVHLPPRHRSVAAEPDAVTELLGCCAGLPLAMSILAARAARHPQLPLRVLAAELRADASAAGCPGRWRPHRQPAGGVLLVLSRPRP